MSGLQRFAGGKGAFANTGAMGGPVTVRAFAFQSETTSIAAAFSVAPTAARKSTIDRAVRKMKAAGIWTAAAALGFVGLDEDASLTDWKRLSKATKTGTPTFVANVGWTATAITQYLNTGLNASSLSQNDHGCYVWSQTTVASNNADIGALDGSSNGISLSVRTASGSNTNGFVCRSASASNQVAVNANHADGYGLNGFSRNNSANFTASCDGVTKNTITLGTVALAAQPFYVLTPNSNGTPSANFTPRQIAFWYLGASLTNAQERTLHGIVGEYLDAIKYGEPVIEDSGIGTAAISADCIAYGFTGQSVLFALQAARAGRTSAIVGGWRDRHFGGMSGGGLGFTDFDNHASLGGLPRYCITRMNAIDGVADTQFYFQPKNFQRVMRELMNPALNGGFTIPVYCTAGVSSVTKPATTITNFKTGDGRTITGLQYFDGSYEGDLMRLAGCSYIVGREAAGSGTEANNGVKLSATNLNFQPFYTANTPASGLIPNVQGIRSAFSPGIATVGLDGTADAKTQAYNFRLTMTTDPYRRVPLPSTPPTGYNVANYEFLLRFLAGNVTVDTFQELFKVDSITPAGVTVNDVNNLNFISTDYVGGSWTYPTATYGARETIWKDTWNYIQGYLYTIQYGTDSRIPAGLKTDALTYGYTQDHYYNTHENDQTFDMPQLYVREAIRMVSDNIFNGNDLTMTDGTAPRISVKTVAAASYSMDSHAIQRLAYESSAGVWETRNEGGLNVNGGGVDLTSPVPLEIVVPKVAECTNLSVGFAVSATHIAFGSIRMEYTAMQIGQTMGQAAALAITGATTIQAIDYPTLRTAILASHPLSGEVAAVLPQVN